MELDVNKVNYLLGIYGVFPLLALNYWWYRGGLNFVFTRATNPYKVEVIKDKVAIATLYNEKEIRDFCESQGFERNSIDDLN